MSDYTPTTEEMREWHVRADHAGNKTRAEYEAEFDRWLEAHDREVAAKALIDFDLTKLREIAEAATPGAWKFATAPAEGSDETAIEYLGGALTGYGPLCVVWVPETLGDPDGYRLTAATGDGPHALMDAAHIAAFDPPTVLELIDEVERLRGVVEQVRDLAESYPPIASTRPVGTEAIRIYERYVVARKILAILGDHLGGGMK